MVVSYRKECIIDSVERAVQQNEYKKTLLTEDTEMTQVQNENQALRDEIQKAIAGVAAQHDFQLIVKSINIEETDETTEVNVDTLTVHATKESLDIEDIVARYVEAHKHVSAKHAKKRYRNRMIIAFSLAVGIWVVYSILHREYILHGWEYLFPVIVDKTIFGLGE